MRSGSVLSVSSVVKSFYHREHRGHREEVPQELLVSEDGNEAVKV